jgi:hypothetical protein
MFKIFKKLAYDPDINDFLGLVGKWFGRQQLCC